MRLLVIEDDPSSRKLLLIAMGREGFAVDSASSATEARGLIEVHRYAVWIVDIGLPEGVTAGLELVRELRLEGHHTPALFLSARGELDDRVAGLQAGGDDYLVKPAHMREVLARVQALMRRPARALSVTQRGDLTMNWEARSVRRGDEVVHLTRKEFALLRVLAGAPGKVFTREEIIARVWDEGFDSDEKLVNVYVKTLRQKLGKDLIESVRGTGYRFPG